MKSGIRFVGLALLAPAISLLSVGCFGKKNLTTEVIVVGAGMSGIAAASELHRGGIDVIVLEARDRIGGRIYSDRSFNKVPFEIGAGWIEGMDGSPLVPLAKTLGVHAIPDEGGDEVFFDAAGHRLPEVAVNRAQNNYQRFTAFLENERERTTGDSALEVSVQRFAKLAGLTQPDVAALNFSVSNTIESDYLGDSRELSMQYFDSDGGHGEDSAIIREGYDEMVTRLAKGLRVMLGQAVTLIDATGEGVVVETATYRVSAPRVIVTVPLGVLQSGALQFKPALPERKRQAMQRLKMGILHRSYFIFEKPFWDTEVHTFFHIAERKGEWPAFVNMQHYNGQPALLAFHGGSAGARLDAMSDAEIEAAGMQVLRKIFGKSVPAPKRFIASHWGKDAWSRGSYSFIPLGATGEEYEILAESVENKIFFAGEATTRENPASVHGAYKSGLREARRILRAVKVR